MRKHYQKEFKAFWLYIEYIHRYAYGHILSMYSRKFSCIHIIYIKKPTEVIIKKVSKYATEIYRQFIYEIYIYNIYNIIHVMLIQLHICNMYNSRN